ITFCLYPNFASILQRATIMANLLEVKKTCVTKGAAAGIYPAWLSLLSHANRHPIFARHANAKFRREAVVKMDR
ncbi:MAG: hypothetical protein ACREXG_12250, partial [Polaromonas sp.]